MYAWKPTIIEEMVREEQAYNNAREVNLVYWIDSGLMVKCEDFDTAVEHLSLQHGIYTPRNVSKIHVIKGPQNTSTLRQKNCT